MDSRVRRRRARLAQTYRFGFFSSARARCGSISRIPVLSFAFAPAAV
ncbi:MAG TPA: hypothetical protein VNN77_17955 [candidate division Zixibacteria bacterium]|nr:hypothetical protein [candidate division Zixibacteria bacterium]